MTSWNKGLSSWSKGLTKETSEILRKSGEKQSKTKAKGIGVLKGDKNPSRRPEVREKLKGHIPWNKGLTKETSEILKRVSEKETKTNKSKFPGIKLDKPIVRYYGWKQGDVIKIIRTERHVSLLAKKSINYRVIIV
jgi:DNA-directed RNA polymerase subunit H (RpoH/RPB5)